MKIPRLIFALAGIYGIGVLLPLYFERAHVDQVYPPAITHLEFYYGFVGLGLAWQAAFLIIASNPARYRPLMLAGVLEKLTYGLAVLVLAFQNQVAGAIMAFGTIDLVWAALFVLAFLRVPQDPGGSR
jgi:hypothetical protein